MALVTGLPLGRTRLTATHDRAASRDGSPSPTTRSSGPVFAGPQVQPWVCDTEAHGLGPPRDKACSTPAVTTYVYKHVLTGRFADYDPAPRRPLWSPRRPPTRARRVPFVVRGGEGGDGPGAVHDRGRSPGGGTARSPSPFGGSCNPRHQQEPVDTGPNELQPTLFSVLDEPKLARGYMVAHNNLGNLGSNCNDVVAAESLMMLKEHIVETLRPDPVHDRLRLLRRVDARST